MKASDYIAAFLHAQGVPQVFELVGGMITHLLDSLYAQGRTRLVSMHHEQAAAFAADAVGRMTGVPGVAMATSGPGATNLLTGIGSCFFDSTPAVFITGQVNLDEQKGARPIRQLGFQETDIVAAAAPLSKAAWRITHADEIPECLANAFRTAISGRPGPVLVDLPFDLQRAALTTAPPVRVHPASSKPCDEDVLRSLLQDLAAARRPLILAGGGIRAARSIDAFRRVVDRLEVPVVSSLLAVDALPYGHTCRVGMIGSYGNRWANLAISEADFLLVLGSRLDIRQTGSDVAAFRGERTIYHVDCDAPEINNRVQGCHAVVADLRAFFAGLEPLLNAVPGLDLAAWRSRLHESRLRWPDVAELDGIAGINPNVLMHQISAHDGAAAAAAYVADVGQHQMWAAQSIELGDHQRFLTSGGMGAMGFGLPAAIGAAVASGQPVVLIAGDGGFQLNIQELQTMVRNGLPIKIVVLDNKCHGMVRQFQQSYFGERYQSTYWGYSAPDFVEVARAYRIEATYAREVAGVAPALERMWRDPLEPFVLHVEIDTFANAYPKLAFGRPISEMEPLVKPTAIENT
jgi:acetolactate synthase-1/2/3 large subunit